MKKIITSLSLGLTVSAVFSQAPSIQWKANFGGTNTDRVKSICKTSDGGYAAVGYTESSDFDVTGFHGNRDIWVVKTDANGALLWSKAIGGGNVEEGNAIIEKSDGDLIIVGYTESLNQDFMTPAIPNYGGKDLCVIRLNSDGTTDWIKKFGGTGDDVANAVADDLSGNGFMVAGYTNSNDNDVSGNHLSSGSSTSTTNDFWVLRFDNSGSIIWKNCYGGNNDEFGSSGDDYATTITSTSTGSYLVAGYSTSVNGDITNAKGGRDIWAVKLNTSGTMVWQKSYGGTSWEEASCSAATPNGFAICGYTQSSNGDVSGNHGFGSSDIWLITIDNNGTLLNQRCTGGTNAEVAFDMKITGGGDYIISGYEQSLQSGDCTSNYGGWDWWIVKLDAGLNFGWEKNIGGPLTELGAYGLALTNDGGYLLAGAATNFFEGSSDFHGSEDYWFVKLGSATGIDYTEDGTVKLFPQPAKEELFVTLETELSEATAELISMNGAVIKRMTFSGKEVKLETGTIAPGFYMLTLRSDSLVCRTKVLIAD